MSPNFKAKQPDAAKRLSAAIAAHEKVRRARAAVDQARADRATAIRLALTAGITLRELGDSMGVSAQAVDAMTK